MDGEVVGRGHGLAEVESDRAAEVGRQVELVVVPCGLVAEYGDAAGEVGRGLQAQERVK